MHKQLVPVPQFLKQKRSFNLYIYYATDPAPSKAAVCRKLMQPGFFLFISVGSGPRQCVTDGSDHQLSVSILKASAIVEKWVGKTREESQRRWRLRLVPCDQIRAAQATALPESTGEGGVYLGVWRGGA